MSNYTFRQGRSHANNIYMHGPGLPEGGTCIAHVCDPEHARTMVACLNLVWPRPGIDLVTLVGGEILAVHSPTKCVGEHCSVHNPSQHHMVKWPQHWRDDRQLMERICPHGTGHPDPDDLEHKKQVMPGDVYRGYAFEAHGCCLPPCCRAPSAVTIEATDT